MVGRTRRGTASSTESVVLSQLHYRPELSVLKPVSENALEDDWPTFELDDAIILGKDGRKLESALDVILNGPFIVRGRMIVEDVEQRKHLVSRVRTPVPIEIWPCQRYSIGETKGGKPSDDDEDDEDENSEVDARPIMSVLWISGQGGWFEVKPAPAYVPIFRDICDAIKLFYTIYDIYQAADTKFRKADNGATSPTERLAPLFLRYAVRVGSGITVQEVEKRCLDVAPFLISQFLDDLSFWRKMYLYEWFKETHEDIFKKVQHFKRNPKPVNMEERAEKPTILSTLPTRSRQESSPLPAATANQRNSSRARSTRSASTAVGAQLQEEAVSQVSTPIQPSQNEATPSSPHNHGEATPKAGDDSVFENLFSIFSASLHFLASQKKGVTLNGLANKLYFDHRFPNFKNGQPGCHRVPAEEVLHYNAKELLTRMDPKYRDTEVYTWLQEKSTTPFHPIAFKMSDFPYPIVPRQKQVVPRGQKGIAQLTAANRAGPSLEYETSSTDRSGSPRAGKSLKGPGRRPKKSTLRLSSSKKRPYSDVDSGSDSDGSGARPEKSHFFQDTDESMEEAGDANSTHEPDNAVRIIIQADKMPSAVPRGHHGTWTCDQDDCDYIVRGGDEEVCQARIRAHFEQHEQQDERVQLAINEGTRGHIQINNLLEKIKRLSEQQEQQEQPQNTPRNGAVVPQPIKTNLIV